MTAPTLLPRPSTARPARPRPRSDVASPVALPAFGSPRLLLLPSRPTPADLVGPGARGSIEPAATGPEALRIAALLVSRDGRVYVRDARGTRGSLARMLSADARLTLEVDGWRADAVALQVGSDEERAAVSCAYVQRFGYRGGTARLLQPSAVEATFEVLPRPAGRRPGP